MGLMMRRQRPSCALRQAPQSREGTAYHMGKKGEQQAQVNEQAQRGLRRDPAGASPPAPACAPPLPLRPAARARASTQLVQFHNSGVLTDEEFSAAKAKLLGI